MEILDSLDPLLKTFWYVAIPSSLFFVIQSVLGFMGGDASDIDFDIEHDSDGGAFQLFSLKNLVNFLLGFSWSGISFFHIIPNKPLLILVAVMIGASFVGVFFLIITQIQKLAEDNSFNISNTISKTAEVYLSIPERKTGTGKILISINGSVHELNAMTEHAKITSGSVVKVVRIEHGNMLIVEPI